MSLRYTCCCCLVYVFFPGIFLCVFFFFYLFCYSTEKHIFYLLLDIHGISSFKRCIQSKIYTQIWSEFFNSHRITQDICKSPFWKRYIRMYSAAIEKRYCNDVIRICVLNEIRNCVGGGQRTVKGSENVNAMWRDEEQEEEVERRKKNKWEG